MLGICGTVLSMKGSKFFFGYFYFSRSSSGREV